MLKARKTSFWVTAGIVVCIIAIFSVTSVYSSKKAHKDGSVLGTSEAGVTEDISPVINAGITTSSNPYAVNANKKTGKTNKNTRPNLTSHPALEIQTTGITGTTTATTSTEILPISLVATVYSPYSSGSGSGGSNSGSGSNGDSNNQPDIQAPSVFITSPETGATISGTTTIVATATDTVGVVSVQFIIDGINFGADLSSAPYQISLDTKSFADGAHLISARASDAAGNISTSSNVSVIISNKADWPESQNLIINPSLEITNSDNLPANWHSSSWGNNDATFSYPVAGSDGDRAAQVAITSHTDGDAKWYFDDVPVTGSFIYTFSDSYKSDIDSELTARFTLSDNTIIYQFIKTLPSTGDDWANVSQELTAPAAAVSLTVFHLIGGVGQLTVDNFSLRSKFPNSDSFNNGAVSLTFDDGWSSHYDNVLPILKANGQKGTFYIISQATAASTETNLIKNYSLETDDGAGKPLNWSSGSWGNNDATFSYPVSGFDGDRAAQVTITSYTDGDAKWYFDDINVTSDKLYRFRDSYKSTAESTITVRYTYTDNSAQYRDFATLPATNDWQTSDFIIQAPQNISSITVFHHLNAVGELTIDNTSLSDYLPYITPAQLLAMQQAGQEIGSHTQNHVFLTKVSTDTAQTEITNSKTDLVNLGINTISSIAYPYGDHNTSIDNIVKAAGFTSGRGTQSGLNTKTTDQLSLRTQSVEVNTTFDVIKTWIDAAMQQKLWLILMFHQIDHQGEKYSATPEMFKQISDYLKNNSIDTKTVSDMISGMDK